MIFSPMSKMENRSALTRNPARKIATRAGLFCGLALLFGGQLTLYYDYPGRDVDRGYLIMGAGLILLIASLGTRIWLPNDPLTIPDDEIEEKVRIRVGWFILSLGLIFYIVWRETQNPNLATVFEYLIVWVLAMLALVMAVRPKRNQISHNSDNKSLVRNEYLLLIGLFIAALAIRAIALDKMPYLLDQDEAAFAREGAAAAYLSHFQVSPFASGWQSHPEMQFMLIGIATALFGPTIFAARIVSAVFGALAVPSVYLLGRELFNRSTALIASLFMLGWTYHIFFSRLAFNQAGDLFFSTLACYFLVRGLRCQTAINYTLSGIILALAQLFYLGARLVPIVFIFYIGYLFFRQRNLIRRQWQQLAILVISFLLITIPQNFSLLHSGQAVTTLFQDQSILSGLLPEATQQGNLVPFLANQIKAALMALFSYQDASWYGPGSNLMGWIGGPLLLLGFFTMLIACWRRPRWILPLLWTVGVILGGAALQMNPSSYERFFPGASGFALLVAAGLGTFISGITSLWGRLQWTKYVIPMAGVLIVVGNLLFFLFDFVPARAYLNGQPNWLTNRLAAEMLAASDSGHYPVVIAGFSTGLLNTVVVQYFMIDRKYTYLEDGVTLTQVFANTDPNMQIERSKPLEFIVSPARKSDLAPLQQRFPGGNLRLVYLTQDDSLAFYVYELDQPPP